LQKGVKNAISANHRHFFRVGEVLEPTFLMVFLPTEFWVKVLGDKGLSVKKYRKKS